MKNINFNKVSLVPVFLLAVAAISSASGDKEVSKACVKDPLVKEAKNYCEKVERFRQCVESRGGTPKEVAGAKAAAGRACGGGKGH